MICLPHDRGWLFISQPAHAWMAGELAVNWGNTQFSSPSPRDTVVLATRLHDIGWLKWDAKPRLGDDGRPVNFLDTNLEETIPVWQDAVQWMRIINPLAALLISMHASTIYGRRLERSVDPPEQRPKVRQAQREHEQLQTKLRLDLAGHPIYGAACREEQLRAAYRWLRICDLLSLALLAKEIAKEGEIDQVPGKNLDHFKTIYYRFRSPLTLEVTPWPFAVPDIQVLVEARYVNQEGFDDVPIYHSRLESAPWQSLAVTLRPYR